MVPTRRGKLRGPRVLRRVLFRSEALEVLVGMPILMVLQRMLVTRRLVDAVRRVLTAAWLLAGPQATVGRAMVEAAELQALPMGAQVASLPSSARISTIGTDQRYPPRALCSMEPSVLSR